MKKILLVSLLINGLYTLNAAQHYAELSDLELDFNELTIELDKQAVQQLVSNDEIKVNQQTTQQNLSVTSNRTLEQLLREKTIALTYDIVTIDYKSITSLVGLNTIKNIEKARRLYISHNQLETIEPEIFDNLSELLYLDLSYNKLSSIDLKLFLKLDNLKFLYLSHNRLRKKNVEEIREYCQKHGITVFLDDQNHLPEVGCYTKAALREIRPYEQEELQLDQKADEEDDVTEKEKTC